MVAWWVALPLLQRATQVHTTLLSALLRFSCIYPLSNGSALFLKTGMQGMEHCHKKGITHWNLKLGNLIVGFSDKASLGPEGQSL